MKKTAIAMLFAPAILAGCAASSGQGSSMDVTVDNMQNHNWVLESVDGKALDLPEGFAAPNLEIGEAFAANGHGGCNRYFGQAELIGAVIVATIGKLITHDYPFLPSSEALNNLIHIRLAFTNHYHILGSPQDVDAIDVQDCRQIAGWHRRVAGHEFRTQQPLFFGTDRCKQDGALRPI